MSVAGEVVDAAGKRVVAALEAAHEAFGAGDAVSGSAALDLALAACRTIDVAGGRLDRATLREALAAHQACAVAALRLQQELGEQLQQCAGARRAARAYAER